MQFIKLTSVKSIFIYVLIIISFFLFKWSSEIGMDGDAPIQIEYGKACLEYFKSFGQDTTYKDVVAFKTNIHHRHIKYYGTGIEVAAASIASYVGKYEFTIINHIRRLLTAFLSIITFLFIGLTVKDKLNSWVWACIAIVLSFLSPTFLGLSFWQTKDAPVATGFIVALYFLYKSIHNYPILKLKYLIGLCLGVALAMSVRIQAILVLFYIGIFGLIHLLILFKKTKLIVPVKFYFILGMCSFIGITIGLMTYPFFWEKGYFAVTEALSFLQKHPQNPPVLFEGEIIKSIELPLYYLPKMMIITFPLFSMLIFFLSFIGFFIDWKKNKSIFPLILYLFPFLFPIIYLLLKDANLYNGWRHEMFLYPSFIVFGVVGFSYFIEELKNKRIIFYSAIVLLGIMVLKTGAWCFKNAPFQYVYYNELVGGTKGAFKHYELDYLQISAEPAARSLLKSMDIANEKGILAANTLILHDMSLPESELSRNTVGFIMKNTAIWNYGVFNPIFVPPKLLDIAYPPKGTIKTINVDGGTYLLCGEKDKF